jgi:hypothetical protein
MRYAQRFHAQVFFDERVVKRGQIRSQRYLNVMMLDGNRCSNLISGNVRA